MPACAGQMWTSSAELSMYVEATTAARRQDPGKGMCPSWTHCFLCSASGIDVVPRANWRSFSPTAGERPATATTASFGKRSITCWTSPDSIVPPRGVVPTRSVSTPFATPAPDRRGSWSVRAGRGMKSTIASWLQRGRAGVDARRDAARLVVEAEATAASPLRQGPLARSVRVQAADEIVSFLSGTLKGEGSRPPVPRAGH